MNIYIWSFVGSLTDNYHSGGGVVVIAETEEKARALADKHGVTFNKEVPDIHELAGDIPETIYLFPDAGCC